MEFDCLAKITNLRRTSIYSGYRPNHWIREDYLTCGIHEYIDTDCIEFEESSLGYIKFISPHVYPRSLYKGRVLDFCEGAKKTGEVEIIEIYNPILVKKTKNEITRSLSIDTNLNGTLTESKIKDRVCSGKDSDELAYNFLTKMYPDMNLSYVIDSLPDQGFKIIQYLVDNGDVVTIEIDTVKQHVEDVEVQDLQVFCEGLSRYKRIKLKILIDLLLRN